MSLTLSTKPSVCLRAVNVRACAALGQGHKRVVKGKEQGHWCSTTYHDQFIDFAITMSALVDPLTLVPCGRGPGVDRATVAPRRSGQPTNPRDQRHRSSTLIAGETRWANGAGPAEESSLKVGRSPR